MHNQTHTKKREPARYYANPCSTVESLGQTASMTIYTQTVVCTGVKNHLKREFPYANSSSYSVSLCVRCGGSDKTDKKQKRGKRKKLDLCRFRYFREFSLEGNNIVITFCDVERPSEAQLPPIWNETSDRETLQRLQVSFLRL
ncbi:hypothetical protein PILCRDRAFT_741100 [Piloderma croceum F 1598]|uniref:Uncharacterized protein n=1 Tax=Piloderma croceum (strain F 1598) TaxID=765440 RepID=A0A0C3EIG4_PILCF|nr:hypothetical protein PILCRDRAFT_741100 [Piloderma croceum F 1598]